MNLDEFLGGALYDVLGQDDEAFERAGGTICDALGRAPILGWCPDCRRTVKK